MLSIGVDHQITIGSGPEQIGGTVYIPEAALGLVIFAHGSGSTRFSRRNRFVASRLHELRFGTLLLDLLTPAEARIDEVTAEHRFNIDLLARRLVAATTWCAERLRDYRIGYFGASTGGGAALVAAAERPGAVDAVVSRGGRPDLAGAALPDVHAPTLLIVGEHDPKVIELNRQAAGQMRAHTEISVIPGASHLFEEPGALDEVARLAGAWFLRYLAPVGARSPGRT